MRLLASARQRGRPAGRLRTEVPRWWRGEAEGALWSGASVALAPAEVLYRLAVAARNALYANGWRRSHRVGAAVVSVGNLAVGGTGKTPSARRVAQGLASRGARGA